MANNFKDYLYTAQLVEATENKKVKVAQGSFTHNGKNHQLDIHSDSSKPIANIELKFDGEKWDISPKAKAQFPATADALTATGFLKKVNSKWKKPSGNHSADLQSGHVLHDHGDVDPIKAHLGKDKKINYLQISGSGFYHTGKDAAGLGSPELAGKTSLRAKMKSKGSGVVSIGMKDIEKSHHDLDAKDQV